MYTSDYNTLSGEFTMKNMGYNGNLTQTIDLNELAKRYPHSGYITMGDNNPRFDQPGNVSGVTGLITYEQIRSVAWVEIPWAGAFRMLWNGGESTEKLNMYAPNTVPCLAASIISAVFLLLGLSFLFDRIYYTKFRRELYEEVNAPTPEFPVEDENE